MTPSQADRARLESWWRACLAARGELPPELEPVRVRPIRAVGKGRLPDLGSVHCKVMAFPRLVDRLRYWWRALPAHHEARLLAHVRAVGLSTPAVVFHRGQRGPIGWPRLSMLVTRTLPGHGGRPAPDAMARCAAALARAGVFHPDLNPDNFVALPDGGCAVLDLQSARRRWRLSRTARRKMAGKLLVEAPAAEGALLESGMIVAADLEAVRECARLLQIAHLRRRIRRCVTSSSEFERRRGWRATLHRRRAVSLEGGAWVAGGAELGRLWWGDRALEVLEGRRPTLGAFRKARWPLRGSAVYVLDPHALLATEMPNLLRGYQRWRALSASGESPRRTIPTSLERSDA